ncbi:tripartite tricarboxylate transporter permease [Aneurinibacillus sp. Ricciae_BoGa-3]|uniref:tripartite tricarboxylate transporter permease n=1 Tax=Aneurinibacillus sp. Ricciae_BoGa-3 TaxID=3022697 RepID=UPI002341F30F|nr:tripartite tricarboxylate transporter permease [Aneurinibacillus sp. Ricciae_BoGa-3]WCK52311.1 tripartite tricarboxylate transporter permease [Aneurinibacillus sp. Ricciae_BoGa-3]
MGHLVLPALQSFFTWPAPLFLLVGVLVGILFGILPGLGGPQVLALLTPLTYKMDPASAIVMLIGAMSAIPLSGSLAAILLNLPGHAPSVASTFDGYPLTLKGKGGYAVGASACSALLSAIFGAIVLTLILPFGEKVVLAFSYPEFFMMALAGLSMITVISRRGSILKGLIAAVMGLMISFFGYDPITGMTRFTFGSMYLYNGIEIVPTLIGLFAVSEGIEMMHKKGSVADQSHVSSRLTGVVDGMKSVFQNFGVFIRSSAIGTFMGMIPGVGGAITTIVAYGQAVQTSKHPERYGKGEIAGVIAPEAANNSKDASGFIPSLIFGIPSHVEMAVLLGSLTILGIEPGPKLIETDPGKILMVIYALVAGNLITAIVALLIGGYLTKLALVSKQVLAPIILAISIIGAYALKGEMGDVYVALAFGILGYLLNRFGFPKINIVIPLMVGKLMETSFHQTLLAMGWKGFVTRPISIVILVIVIAVIFITLRKNRTVKMGMVGDVSEST